jgi:L-erythro-3,5-diaminohexanoate dehydrogenase
MAVKEKQVITTHPLGLHRVLDDPKVLPQNAQALDNQIKLHSNELSVDVDFLQIDSASFAQLKTADPHEDDLKKSILSIVEKRGKMQNPVTGSGGMLLGNVLEVGKDYPDQAIKVGDRIATLVSLTATPLDIKAIHHIDFAKERIEVDAKAFLFAKSLYAKMPDGISDGAALAAFDICGAPLIAVNHAKVGDTVFVLGLGKAGKAVMAALRYRFGDKVTLLGADANEVALDFCAKNYGAITAKLNAQDPIEVLSWVEKNTQGELADFVINLVNVPHTEMPTILSTKDTGKSLFFSMATDFQKATLGCESVAKDVTLLMGIGYTKGHADFMIEVLRKDAVLQKYFEEHFG